MPFTVDTGIPESELAAWLMRAAKKFGTFDDGRVNYTNADIAPIVMCIVVCGKEILLVKRGYGLADAEGYWSTINGFIDEVKPVREQAVQELSEELGFEAKTQDIQVALSFTLTNPAEKRRYIVFPCKLVLAKKPKIVLNEENTHFEWITRDKLESYEMLEDTPFVIDAALKL